MAAILTATWTLLASALLASLTAWFQLRNWRNQDLVRLREKEQEAAVRVVSEFTSLISKRIHRQKRFLWAVREGQATHNNTDVIEYRAVLNEWNDQLREIQARLAYSFDRNVKVAVESQFHNKLARIHQTIERSRIAGSCDKENLAEADRLLSALGWLSTAFTEELMQRARSLDLSAFNGKDGISFRNRQNLSVSYLFFRLFGIAEKPN